MADHERVDLYRTAFPPPAGIYILAPFEEQEHGNATPLTRESAVDTVGQAFPANILYLIALATEIWVSAAMQKQYPSNYTLLEALSALPLFRTNGGIVNFHLDDPWVSC